MKKKLYASLLTMCLGFSACNNVQNSVPEDISASENYTESTVETTLADDTSETITETTVPLEKLSDYDIAIRLAAELIENKKYPSKYILYDFDLDGIPELMEKTGFMDTEGWEIYKLSGTEALDIGYFEHDEYPESASKPEYYHADELTLESGIHIYRDTEKGEIFYVTEYITELHTEGFATGIRYDIYADKLAETELYRCDFFTYDDCGASGNRYIAHNILNGEQASPRYRVNCNAEGFLYCNEFGDYLSNFEYLGMINTENCYSADKYDSFYDYAETVKIPEKTKDERTYFDSKECVTICGKEYYADTYAVSIRITNENFNDIDLSELKLLPKLEKLTIDNDSDSIVDLSALNEIDTITELMLYSSYRSEGDFDRSALTDMDNIIITNAAIEYASQMKSVKVIYGTPLTDNIDGFAPLYDMEQLEVVLHHCSNNDSARKMQLDRLKELRPDLLLIYVP